MRCTSVGECIVGALSPTDRDAFEEALIGEASLQAEVYCWQDRLLPLARRMAAEQPARR